MNTRKNYRLKEYDYSENGCYFITICTKDRKNIFWETNDIKYVGEACSRPCGADSYNFSENNVGAACSCSQGADSFNLTENNVSISRVIKQFKMAVSKKIGYSIWQKLFYDNILRNERTLKR